MAAQLIPRIVVAALLWTAAYFVFFETLYLQDQARQFGDARIVDWMWVFRGGTLVLVGLGLVALYSIAYRLIAH